MWPICVLNQVKLILIWLCPHPLQTRCLIDSVTCMLDNLPRMPRIRVSYFFGNQQIIRLIDSWAKVIDNSLACMLSVTFQEYREFRCRISSETDRLCVWSVRGPNLWTILTILKSTFIIRLVLVSHSYIQPESLFGANFSALLTLPPSTVLKLWHVWCWWTRQMPAFRWCGHNSTPTRWIQGS